MADELSGIRILRRRLEEMDAVMLYRLLWMRSRVFNGEQHATDDDLDGRDLEPSSSLMWAQRDGLPIASLRLLDEDGTTVIGRLVTEPEYRGRGIAGALLRDVLDVTEGPLVLHAQAHLADWYARFGFIVDGPEFMEAGIPHVPMRMTR
ncbi:GNAT family N-acetyltransferase [Acidipropionibacterium virtanenii]|uniref:Acetyltransferase n=1 Tax=Acidipropionibacterium virtanenii TaxID=2057246 RepID=A0A344UT26_9ACTN|nr:GNAT family N-acetyltransferase [Acidipropionibacterium virtanenii]AXE38424.1 Acetyltransferase [Acidipropionibacterium virtanenii]